MPCLEPRGVERGRRRKIYDKATLILIHGTVSLELATGDGEKQRARERKRGRKDFLRRLAVGNRSFASSRRKVAKRRANGVVGVATKSGLFISLPVSLFEVDIN